VLRARIEAVLAVACGILAAITLVWPTWIEKITGLEPDAGTGETEWGLVVVLGAFAVVAALLAGRDFRRAARHH
jgi:hypothetical protein